MLKYFISICILLLGFISFAQETFPTELDSVTQNKIKAELAKDTMRYKSPYGFRLGADISKPIIKAFNEDYTGFELVGDYRVRKNLYIAAELGYEEKKTEEDFTTSTANGTYVKLGVNLNLYKNWLDMNNEIYIGGRYGFSVFEQTLNEYNPNTTDYTYSGYFTTTNIKTPNTTQTALTMHWLEFQLGTKVETFKNLFIGFSTAFKVGLSTKNQDGFETLYAPGFNRVYSSKTGFGFNYTISYLIPFQKK